MSTVVISIEIELGWGQHDRAYYNTLSDQRKKETEVLGDILSIADENEVQITFDIVGHLFLRECDGEHGQVYQSGWFNEDPKSDREHSPLFYADDMIEMILDAQVDHEIATHTFSHVLCEEVNDAVLRRELESVTKVHKQWELERPTSLVPPRHSPPDYEILSEYNVDTVRVPTPKPAKERVGQYISRIKKWLVNSGHDPHRGAYVGDIYETYSTPYPSLTAVHLKNGQQKPPMPFRMIPLKIRQRIHSRYLVNGLEAAAQSGKTSHFWTHLQNAANEQQIPPIKNFFECIRNMKKNGEITVLTMDELSDREDTDE